jgi:hypothetical protein
MPTKPSGVHETGGTPIAPIAERVASLLLERDPTGERLPTPLTQANRRADRAQRHQRTPAEQQARTSRPERRCKRCGGRLPHRDRVYCDDCLPYYQRDRYEAFVAAGRENVRGREAGCDPAHSGEAREKRAASNVRRKRELREWEAEHGKDPIDRSMFEREILPAIQGVPLSDLVRATGLTHVYLSQIRRGRKVPHPRHWPALATASSPR